MRLIPLKKRHDLVHLAGGWLEQPANWRWLDPGIGGKPPGAMSLHLMTQRDNHELRVFTADDGEPAGLVALSHIDRRFRTGMLWFLLGDKRRARRGLTRRAADRMLDVGFGERSLRAIYAWAVAVNHASVHILESLNFRRIGRQRLCHCIGDQVCDRLHFDLLHSEHKEVTHARHRATG